MKSMSKQSILFIINPISGTKAKTNLGTLIHSKLNLEMFDYDIAYTQYAGHASELSINAVNQNKNIIVAVGGDGTINEVARTLVHTDSILGIIPFGSGNGLARHLHIPMNPELAIDIINKRVIRRLDYGLIDGHPFFCTCGVGFDAFVSFKFATSERRGMLSYLENTLKEGVKYKPETYIIENEDGTQHFDAFLIACANASQYGNNAYIAPKASMEDGLFDVIIMEPFNALEAPQIAIQLFNKTLDHNSHIKMFRSKKIRIYREHCGEAHCDGEPILTGKEINIELRNQGINMLINPDFFEVGNKDNPFQIFVERFRDISRLHNEFIKKSGKLNKSIIKTIKRSKNVIKTDSNK